MRVIWEVTQLDRLARYYQSLPLDGPRAIVAL